MLIRREPFVFICLLFIGLSPFLSAKPQFSSPGPHNFGIVVHNSKHTIYRAGALGKKGLENLAAHLKARGLPFPKTIISMNIDGYRRTFKHLTLFAVQEYEEREEYGFTFYHSFDPQFSSYLSGQNPYQARSNNNQAKYLGLKAQEYFGFDESREIIGGIEDFFRIMNLILTADGPVLFHCTGGRHRTGMVAMAIRYIQGGEWLAGSYVGNSSRTKLNAAQYEYYLHNRFGMRKSNFEFIEQLVKDPRFEELKTRYQVSLNRS